MCNEQKIARNRQKLPNKRVSSGEQTASNEHERNN